MYIKFTPKQNKFGFALGLHYLCKTNQKLKKMKKLVVLLLCALAFFGFQSCHRNETKETPVRVLLVTSGGENIVCEDFTIFLNHLPIEYSHYQYPYAHDKLTPDLVGKYDVVMLFNITPHITDEAQQNFIAMLEKGIGLLVFHHAIWSYDYWPEFTNIVGGRGHHYPWIYNGEEQPRSLVRHDTPMSIHVVDPNHPITKGVSDFEVIDEAYRGLEILPHVTPLLSTDSEWSAPLVAWAHEYGNSRVATITLGHCARVWEHPALIQVVSQAIKWAK